MAVNEILDQAARAFIGQSANRHGFQNARRESKKIIVRFYRPK